MFEIPEFAGHLAITLQGQAVEEYPIVSVEISVSVVLDFHCDPSHGCVSRVDGGGKGIAPIAEEG